MCEVKGPFARCQNYRLVRVHLEALQMDVFDALRACRLTIFGEEDQTSHVKSNFSRLKLLII